MDAFNCFYRRYFCLSTDTVCKWLLPSHASLSLEFIWNSTTLVQFEALFSIALLNVAFYETCLMKKTSRVKGFASSQWHAI